jgi:hypothetical protein
LLLPRAPSPAGIRNETEMSPEQTAAQPAAAPFAVLFLPELLNATVEQSELFLPFTFVYLLSMHVRFCLPVSEAALPLVEKVFDQVLDGHSLHSKGVAYVVAGEEQISQMLKNPLLVVTSESGAIDHPELQNVPQVLMCRTGDKSHLVRLRNIEKLADEELKGKLVGCAQLINIQSSGFTTEGHFSLSW